MPEAMRGTMSDEPDDPHGFDGAEASGDNIGATGGGAPYDGGPGRMGRNCGGSNGDHGPTRLRAMAEAERLRLEANVRVLGREADRVEVAARSMRREAERLEAVAEGLRGVAARYGEAARSIAIAAQGEHPPNAPHVSGRPDGRTAEERVE